jgi:hypothetical protein
MVGCTVGIGVGVALPADAFVSVIPVVLLEVVMPVAVTPPGGPPVAMQQPAVLLV